MYKGFCEDVEYVMGLFFKPFEGCCPDDEEREDEEEKDCGMGCDSLPCCRDDDESDSDEEEKGGLLGTGPVQDILKCMFDASDVDYDYED